MELQTEAAECGLVSIAMVASYFGHQVGATELRRRFGLSLTGASLKELVRIADEIGLASRPVRLDMHELGLLRTPCILHWDLNHFVVLKSVGRNDVTLHDPAVGLRRMSLAEASRHFTGVALELTPTGGFETAAPPPRVKIRALLGRLQGVGRSLTQLLALALALEAFALLAPLFMVWVIDDALVTADRDLLTTLVLAFGLLLVLQTAVSAMRDWVILTLGASLKVQARTNLFSHLINLPPNYFETRYVADVMSRFGSQETILQAITTDLVVGVLDGLMCAVTLALMFVFAPTLTLVVVAGAALYVALRWALYGPLRQAQSEAIIWAARRDGHFLETLRGIGAIKLFNGYEDRRAHWLNLLVETINRQLTTQKLELLFKTANLSLLGALALAVVWLGALNVLEGAFTVGMLVAFIAYKDIFVRRISDLTDTVVELKMLRLHAERLADIALARPEARDRLIGEPAPARRPLVIEARGVSFRYSVNDRWVLKDIGFRVEAGDWVAIAGPSGCGKTTLLKILAGLLEPTDGTILVDGEPLKSLGPDRYRTMLGVVMQDDQLFAGSIADNISFFASRPDFGRVQRCARMAAVHDEIAAMPMGYGTLTGDMGAALSGGQKQRVLIARALYREPSVLLMDEATSHLDVERERAVNAAMRETKATRIVVAHRPETIDASDRVITLRDGRVVLDERERRGGRRPEGIKAPASA
ncbi:peptidase domain-containing ABC transporter [Hansschlegelia zhihuaiae]|uniref:Peptidase domain-containing ABC transporter n=1 Tax=Hansschlegelia zhihuaiae TaxID=405005 RepID=A0A4Q0ML14_9HYPH|nr:peptidase domain-containing ABC transporter [Hansschlegelia zhihuaiae]RXF73736.1 peptidase domain-containing ABC transporter [Hansschlegelia zhihuaiae]